LERGLNGIGGFYVEKCNINHHSYIVSKKIKVYESRESQNGLLSPIFSESGFDEDLEKETVRKYDTRRDFTISVQKDMASQLIHGYAQLLATVYLMLEKWGSKNVLMQKISAFLNLPIIGEYWSLCNFFLFTFKSSSASHNFTRPLTCLSFRLVI
jgi:hypothetical protein